MWLVAIRTALLTMIAINLVIFGLHIIVETEINRVVYVWLGIFGTLLVMLSLGYILVKYWFRSLNRLKTWLYIHMVAGGTGAFFILLHSELYLRAIWPAVALIAMELVAFTGVIGRYLFLYATQKLHREAVVNKAHDQILSDNGDEYVLLVLTTRTLRVWRKIHVQLSWLLLILTVIHVVTELIWRGLRI